MSTYRKRPVEVEVSDPWTGHNIAEMIAFTGSLNFKRTPDDGDKTAAVWDHLHDTWVGVKEGQRIIKGTNGEFYPIDPAVFADTYEPAGDQP